MNELFNCLYLGREKGLDVKVIVNDRVIPIIVTNMETSSLSYEQRIKIKLDGIIEQYSSMESGVSNIPFDMMYEKVIFNEPATIVIWKDGSKTVVKCQKNDEYDPEKGLALCFMKKALGNNCRSNSCHVTKGEIMPFWKKKKSKQQKSTAKEKPAVGPVKPKQRPSSLPPKYEPPKMPDYILKKEDALKTAINQVYGSKSEKAVTPSTVQQKNSDTRKEFLRVFGRLTTRHRAWDVWRDFVVMFACSLSNPVDKSHYDEREKRYLKIINKYNREEQQLFPELAAHTVMALEENPEQDFLGGIFMELGLGDGKNGQFFTPYHICDLMAKITVDDVSKEIEEKGYVTIHDPCCGAGATLIAGVHEVRRQLEKMNLNYQNHVLVVAQDIDEVVALMCYIHLSLLGVAAYIKVGDVFCDPIREGDSTENYWFTMMYFSDVWQTRLLIRRMDDILKGENKDDKH